MYIVHGLEMPWNYLQNKILVTSWRDHTANLYILKDCKEHKKPKKAHLYILKDSHGN